MTVIGVISDTHGLLRPSALEALRDCALILHAGDIGKPAVLAGLRRIAPLVAIRGNVDLAWAHDLPDTARTAFATKQFYLVHNLRDLAIDPRAERIDVVVSGHSHVPLIQRRDGVLYVNPGSAGPRRFKLPICVARLEFSSGGIDAELVELERPGAK